MKDKEEQLPPLYFQQLSLPKILLRNLEKLGYVKLSPIQSYCIPELMAGHSVLGIARVGSGKTLAFLIPVLIGLIKLHWRKEDGLGALIVVPTRELGMQIFTVLNKVADGMKFTCGLICGGHPVEEERKLLKDLNILIATPGRLIQHLEEARTTIGENLKYMIFDEIDSLLEQGFLKAVKEIVDYFPQPYVDESGLSRKIGMFSATESTRI